MNNQGRRKDQTEFSNKMVMGAIGGIIGVFIFCLITLLFSCGITKTTTHNCELMEQGQKCLPDHSCCKK